jgi:endonuclease/exonuclease/phosphatase family metal-dependent hydrolase
MKAQDFACLLARVPRDMPLIVAGDFNAIAPADQPDLDAMEKTFAPFSRDPRASADRFIQAGRQVFPMLESLGLRDGVPAANRGYSIPTDVLSTDKSSGMRIDHAWVNQHVRIRSARIIRDALTNKASDHYPLLLDLDLLGRPEETA